MLHLGQFYYLKVGLSKYKSTFSSSVRFRVFAAFPSFKHNILHSWQSSSLAWRKSTHNQNVSLKHRNDECWLFLSLIRISLYYNYCTTNTSATLRSLLFLAMGCDHEYFLHYWMITWNRDPSNNCSPMATERASTNKWVFWYKRSTAGMHSVNNWLVESSDMKHVWPVICKLLI